jgi:cytochrome c5
MKDKPDITYSVIALMVIGGIIYFTHNYFQQLIAPPSSDMSTLQERIAPLGKLNVEGDIKEPKAQPQVAKSTEVDGESIYNKSCASCHAVGILNAPKPKDEANWTPRLAQGISGLVESAVAGKGMMPPRGGCSSCSDDDLKSAIQFMTDFPK